MLLVLTFCVGLTIPALATSEGEVVIDHDGIKATVQQFENRLVVKVEYENRYEITTRENDASTMLTQVFNYDGTVIDTYVTNIPSQSAAGARDYYQHTFFNYEYDVDTSQRHEIWTCRRNNDYKTKTRLPGSVTEDRLLNWKEEVDNINAAELQIIVGAGSTVLSAVVDSLKAGQLGAAIAMVEGSIELVRNVDALYTAKNNADSIFAKL